MPETTERDWLEALDPWRYHFALTVDAGEGVYVPGMKALVTLLVSLALVPAALGAESPHPSLDAIATSIAGKPVHVWCELNETEWDALAQRAGFGHGYLISGVTFFDEPVVYVSPQLCATLHTGLDSGDEVGPFWLSFAILTLAHESIHQRGVRDEGEADCTALTMVRDLAVNWFHYPKTVRVPSLRTVYKTVVRKKMRIRVKTQQVVWKQVPNPRLESLYQWALRWHRNSGPAYQGGC
jgi:hypothetical protein